MPDSEEVLRQIEVHQRRWRQTNAEEVAFSERMVEWRESQKGNLWTRVYLGSIETRITIFPSRYHPGEFSFVWSRQVPDPNDPFTATVDQEKHFNRARNLTTIEAAKRAALIECGYLPSEGDAMPAPAPSTPARPVRTAVPPDPPARKIVL